MIQLNLFNSVGEPSNYSPSLMDIELIEDLRKEVYEDEVDYCCEYIEDTYAFYVENSTLYPILDFQDWYSDEYGLYA
jgi:hypothetical protein